MSASPVWMWTWWSFMVIINVVNFGIAIRIFDKSRKVKEDQDSSYRKWMLTMGLIFTFVGLYRSIFVTSYGEQRAWFDTLANSTVVVRLLAMFAELSFSGLIAYSMLKFNTYLPPKENTYTNSFKKFLFTKSPYVLVSCIFLAQFFVNTAVITKFSLLFAIEETLWSIGFLSILPLAIVQLRRVFAIKEKETIDRLRKLRISAIVIMLWCAVYCSYGLFYHLPGMWIEQIELMQTGYPALLTGGSAIVDAFRIIHVEREYSDWGFGFMFWHSAYFSVCVWISVFLMQAPRPLENQEKPNAKLTRLILISLSIAIVMILIFIIVPIL